MDEVEFAPLKPQDLQRDGNREQQRLYVPAHRYAALRTQWAGLVEPLTAQMKLQVRYNPGTRNVELRTCEATVDPGSMQRGCDFVQAFLLGFELRDALVLLRLDDIFIESFEIKDVKSLSGDHLSRAIGRIAGNGGKTKFAIENATHTRIVLADDKIHLLGSYNNIKGGCHL